MHTILEFGSIFIKSIFDIVKQANAMHVDAQWKMAVIKSAEKQSINKQWLCMDYGLIVKAE